MRVKSIQTKSHDAVVGPDVQQLRVRTRLLVCAVNRAAALSLRVAHRKCGQVRHQRAPVHREALPLADCGEIWLPGQSEDSARIPVVVIRNRTWKPAAREDVRAALNPA